MKVKNYILIIAMSALTVLLSSFLFLSPAKAYSDSERRSLAQPVGISQSAVKSGKFMTDFEKYTLDQFPLRDKFRAVKAIFSKYVLGQKDNNKIYIYDGYAAKMEYPASVESIDNAAQKINKICNKYLSDTESKIYISVIPDKNFFLADESGHLSASFDVFEQRLLAANESAKYIDIYDLVEKDSFYRTDVHWRQEKLVGVAQKIASETGASLNETYTENTLNIPFYGVYSGQSALTLTPDTITYLTNDIIDGCHVYDYQNDTESEMYDMEKANGKDPYEMFLSGPISLMTIENPTVEDRELIIFRDSFGSSIAPLLSQVYSKITLVDIRYLASDYLGSMIDFHGQDVLFLYSTLVLNNSNTMK